MPPVWSVAQIGLPGDDHLRGLGSLAAFSPNYERDGILIAASTFALC